MKKIFTLIAVALLGGAVSVYAQGTYYVPESFQPADNGTVTDVANVTMTWGTGFNTSALVEGKFEDENFCYKVGGSTNPTKGSLTPTDGTYVKFVPTLAGTISVAYKLNKNKTQRFVEDGVEINTIAETTGSSQYLLTPFDVKANSTYYVFTDGSKMEFFGFIYTVGVKDGINNIATETEANANAPIYNLAGQQVSKDFKGVCIQNGKKFINK